ncbi:GNAT family N-acetyltransferase [Pelagibius sp.]|uniref:GNAT family N-acetyltransferase n=1 Tax=Pelagibius sp. TaxID=1931238 RepID=UPI002626E09E|nr:GNAT family N-acetyltransferase [Pelagibius sp.]
MNGEIEIRTMKRADLDTAIDWARDEGWNPGLGDAACFHAADPEGFLMAFEAGRPAASISVVGYGPDYGFLGFYICRPELRGRGLGFQLWRAGLARMGRRCIGLDGVVDQQGNYRKEGFVLAHRNLRFGGTVACGVPDDPRLQGIGPALLEPLLAYDRPFFPGPRDTFLTCWLQQSEQRFGYALVDDGTVTGYGVLRRCVEGYKFGPLFADTAEGADLLFRALATRSGGAPVYLDPPAPNPEGIALAERYGLAPVFETARMYRAGAPKLPLDRTFGITSFELG